MMPPVTAVVDALDPRRLLPPREGSLILVLGGTAVLIISLTLTLVTGRSSMQSRGSPTPSVGPRPKRLPHRQRDADRARPRTRLEVQGAVLKASACSGIGTPQVVTATPGRYALVLVDCLRCQPAGKEGCEWKRSRLEQALRQFDPGATVTRVQCSSDDQRPCIFEIRPGDGGT